MKDRFWKVDLDRVAVGPEALAAGRDDNWSELMPLTYAWAWLSVPRSIYWILVFKSPDQLGDLRARTEGSTRIV